MMVKHNELVLPDQMLSVRESSKGVWTLTCTLVSGRDWTTSDTLEGCIKLFNSKWTLDYVKKW